MSVFVDFLTRNFTKTWFGFATALIASILTIASPIYLHGFRESSDMSSHLSFAHAFQAAFSGGELYPGWANDNLGFGSVGIRLYPPLSAFFSAVSEFATGDWHCAYSLNVFEWMLAGSFGMFLFVREWSSPGYGIFAGILYCIVPYHLSQIFHFFLYAEFAAMAVLPFCFLYLTRLCRRGNWSDVTPLAVSSSLLVLTHIPLTVMMGFTALAYVPFVIDWRKWKTISLQLILTGATVGAATAFFWVRVVTEVLWVSHSNSQYTVLGNPRGPMLFPYVLADYDITSLRPFLRYFDILTTLTIALLIPSFVVLITGKRNAQRESRRVIAATTLSAGIGIFMFSKPSSFLWTNIEIFARLQYPWRWLAVVSALSVASISLSLAWFVEEKRIAVRSAVFAALFLVIFFAAADIRQVRSAPFSISRDRFNELANEVQSDKVAEHWWPVWANSSAFENMEPVTAGDRQVQLLSWEAERRKFLVDEGSSTQARVATFYYPYWSATVNGQPVEIDKAYDGTIILPIGEGRSDVDLRFEEPLLNRVAAGMSTAVSILMIAALFFPFLRRMKRKESIVAEAPGS